jgi:hypothetical protein
LNGYPRLDECELALHLLDGGATGELVERELLVRGVLLLEQRAELTVARHHVGDDVARQLVTARVGLRAAMSLSLLSGCDS